jgi:hypothetical protein
MRTSEAATRAKLIDPLLTEAGWNLNDRTQVDFEIPVDGYDKEPWNGITDYCLFHPSGEVLAVVEAKKTSRDPREGQEQLRIYLDKVRPPPGRPRAQAETCEFPHFYSSPGSPVGSGKNGVHPSRAGSKTPRAHARIVLELRRVGERGNAQAAIFLGTSNPGRNDSR